MERSQIHAEIFGGSPPWIVGILNVTPDSFSDGGLYTDVDTACERGIELARQGARVIDIGGESTGPGATPVPAEEEWRRIGIIIERLAPQMFFSIDTYKAEIADRALRLGARMVNDVSGMRADPEMAKVVRGHGALIVIMYSKEAGDHPHVSDAEKEYDNLFGTLTNFFNERVDYALTAGISPDKIILDPGMGRFVSHRSEYSWDILRNLHRLRESGLNFPLMIGVSRKGFLGGPVSERDPISQFVGVAAHRNGADFIRTHNVAMAKSFFGVAELLGVV